MKDGMQRLARANVASGVGAGLLGINIGLLFHDALLSYFPAILFLGLALHCLGMYERHRIENRSESRAPRWMQALYGVCWLGLTALAAYVAFESLRR